MKRALAGLAVLGLVACGNSDAQTLSVGRWASPNPGSVNAFWIDAPDGLVVVDAGRNVSGGQKIAAEITKTGQPVAAILLTHPHPDHVGGLGVLHERFPSAPIYASQSTADWMRNDPLDFYPLARQADPDYPETLTYPTTTFGPDAELQIAGLTFQTAQFPAGESETATAFFEPSSRALFGGDLTGNRVTPSLIEGNSCGALTNLTTLSERFGNADIVYPGHGDPGPLTEQIDNQRAYLRHFRDLVRPAVAAASDAGSAVSPAETASIAAELDNAYPNHPRVASLPNLQELNIAAVGRELATEARATLPPECTT